MSNKAIVQLEEWHRRIERAHPFETGAAPYVDLDEVRSAAPALRLVDEAHLDAHTNVGGSVRFLVGARGVGRSTELRRIARELAKHVDLAVLFVDLGRHGVWVQPPTADELGSKLALEIGYAAYAKLGMSATSSLASPQDIVEEIATRVAPRRLVLLVDHLDALALPQEEVARGHLRLAELLVYESPTLVFDRCSAVYTLLDHVALAEPQLLLAFGRPSARFLPAVRVWSEPGGRGLEEAAVLRLEDVLEGWVDLDVLFGIHRPECVLHLVMLSGGNLWVLRELLLEVLRVAEGGGLPVAEEIVERAVRRVRSRLGTFEDRTKLLRRVRDGPGLCGVERAEIRTVVEAMHRGLIQTYHGGRGKTFSWRDVHPLAPMATAEV